MDRCRNCKKGQTLVEALIAMTVISIAALVLLRGVTAGARLLVRAAEIREAEGRSSYAVQQQISRMENYTEQTVTVEINGEIQTRQVKKITVTDPENEHVSYSYYSTCEVGEEQP